MNRTVPVTRVVGATMGIALVITLAGCFGNPVEDMAEDLTQGGVEEIVEGAAGGGTDIEFGEMPEDFPDNVPLVSDKVVQGMSVSGEDGGEGTTVIVSDPRSVKELAQQVMSDFSGWEEQVWSDMGELVTGTFTRDGMSVTVGITAGAGTEDPLISYTVITEAS